VIAISAPPYYVVGADYDKKSNIQHVVKKLTGQAHRTKQKKTMNIESKNG